MRYLVLSLLLIGCAKTENNNVPKTISSTAPAPTVVFNRDILGNWELVSDGGKPSEKGILFEFTSEDLYLIVKGIRFKNGRYKFIDNNTIELELSEVAFSNKKKFEEAMWKRSNEAIAGSGNEPPPATSNVERFDVGFSKDKMILTDHRDKDMVLRRTK